MKQSSVLSLTDKKMTNQTKSKKYAANATAPLANARSQQSCGFKYDFDLP
jgi:hypothetical protein